MDNQHRQIVGYRELSQGEIDKMNDVKMIGQEIGSLVQALQCMPDADQRWVAIGMTHLQQGLMALTRAIAKPTFFVFAFLLLAGCLSPYKQPDGSYLVTKHSEVRSPFGTNGGFDFLERCKGPEKKVLFYLEADFTNCEQVEIEPTQAAHKSSQGQGGQIMEGAMNAGALGAAIATRAGGNAAASAGAVAIQSTTVTVGKGHRR